MMPYRTQQEEREKKARMMVAILAAADLIRRFDKNMTEVEILAIIRETTGDDPQTLLLATFIFYDAVKHAKDQK